MCKPNLVLKGIELRSVLNIMTIDDNRSVRLKKQLCSKYQDSKHDIQI